MFGGEQRQVRRLACRNASRHSERTRRAGGEQLYQAHQRHATRVHELLETERQGRFKSGYAEGRAIKLHVFERRFMRRVVSGDGIHGSVGQSGQQGVSIGSRSQRWIHLEARVVGEVLVDECEVVRGNLASDRQASLLGPSDQLERGTRGKMRDVQPPAGQFGHLDVARHGDRFGRRGHAAQPQADRLVAFAHYGAGRQRGILAVVNHRQVERAAVVHHLTQQAGSGDGPAVVADGDDAGLLHRRNLRELFAFAAARRGADGPNAHAGSGLRAFQNGARHRGVVVHRLGVGHGAHRGEAAASSGAGAALKGL